MPEVHHHPSVHRKSRGSLIIELGMISVAVFLGLMADQGRTPTSLPAGCHS
jgi:hypothetical protein